MYPTIIHLLALQCSGNAFFQQFATVVATAVAAAACQPLTCTNTHTYYFIFVTVWRTDDAEKSPSSSPTAAGVFLPAARVESVFFPPSPVEIERGK